MVKSCSIKNCRKKGYIPGLSFHEFPANLTVREEWVRAMQISGWVPGEHSLLCSRHFKEEDYSIYTLTVSRSKKRRLKKSAVPSLFPESPNYKPRKPKLRNKVLTKHVVMGLKRSEKQSEQDHTEVLTTDLSAKQPELDRTEDFKIEIEVESGTDSPENENCLKGGKRLSPLRVNEDFNIEIEVESRTPETELPAKEQFMESEDSCDDANASNCLQPLNRNVFSDIEIQVENISPDILDEPERLEWIKKVVVLQNEARSYHSELQMLKEDPLVQKVLILREKAEERDPAAIIVLNQIERYFKKNRT